MANPAPKIDPEETFLTAEEVAQRYRTSESTLANHRSAGTGLPFVKINGKVLYPVGGLADAEDVGAAGRCEATLRRAMNRVFGKAVADQKSQELWVAFCELSRGDGGQ